MRSLFLKIFLWFWLATALVALTNIIASITVDSQEGPDRFFAGRMNVYGTTAAEKLERDGSAAASDYLEMIEGATGTQAYLFDADSQQVAGRRAGPVEQEAAANPQAERRRLHFPPGPPRMRETVLSSASGKKYTLVAENHPPPGAPFGPRIRWLALITEIVTAGILCYWLARYLSSPIAKLRIATRKFAAGDLSARLGPQLGKRRDELADMGRDFDVMAERIESMVLSERRLLHDISHELRSPLARLRIALELARQGDGAEAVWALDRIEREAERLNAMVGQVLTLARLEEGSGGPGEGRSRTTVDLDLLIREVVEDADFEAKGRNRSVNLLTELPCRMEGVPELLHSAIENVVRNAVIYTAEGTEVEVSLQIEKQQQGAAEPPTAVVRVRDHGHGVPDQALANIFRPFYRVAEARDRETGGSGLGLSISQRAVQLHGGTVSAVNATGGGLCVEIRLPVLAAV